MMILSEGETVELKESLGEWKEIVRTCAAFATAHGGRIFIGVADDGRVVGVQIGKGTMEDLANKIAQNTVPKLVPAITTQQEQGQTVIHVEVAESPTKQMVRLARKWRDCGSRDPQMARGNKYVGNCLARGLLAAILTPQPPPSAPSATPI